MNKHLAFFILIIHCFYSFNQTLQFDKTDTTYSNSPSIYRLEAQYNCAILLADPTDGLTNVKPENYSGVDFRVLKESYGNKKWQQLYSYPEYGLGIHQGFYYLPDAKPGIPTSVYGFFNAPFRKKEINVRKTKYNKCL